MQSRNFWTIGLGALLCLALPLASGCGENCVDNEEYFRAEVQGEVLTPICMGCHTASGVGGESDLVLESGVRPDYLKVNRAMLEDLAGLERNNTSIILLKPSNVIEHGGGEVLNRGSAEYKILQEFVRRTKTPKVCGAGGRDAEFAENIELLNPVETLRKASLLLNGRMPTKGEIEDVRFGGEPELEAKVRALMNEKAFENRMKEWWNDVLLTDAYMGGSNAIGLVDYDRFLNLYWYEEAESSESSYRARVNSALAQEALELVAYVTRENRPFTEVLTADYVMVNGYSAMSYGIEGAEWPDLNDPATQAFYPAALPDYPHAGVLTTSAFLNRYPTTATNRNRHRAWAFYKKFLATDILLLAERPVDPTSSSIHNPTMNDAQCAVCHTVMDPVAGSFQNWTADGVQEFPENGWFADMRPPGFGRADLPADDRFKALQWLAVQSVAESRFDYAMTRTMLEKVTGLPLLDPQTTGGHPELERAFEGQQTFLESTMAAFAESDHNIKEVVLAVVMSHYFRAKSDAGAEAGDLVLAGTAKLLTPEELTRKIEAVLGLGWNQSDGDPYLLDRYQMLYGGIDSDAVTDRLNAPNGIIANIGLRMATMMACDAVSQDFVLPLEQRRLFNQVEVSYQPLTDEGFEVPESEQAIKRNIRSLALRITGEDRPVDDVEMRAAYDLWNATWEEGKTAVQNDEVSSNLPSACRATSANGHSLPDPIEVVADPNYTIRSWMAVTAYFLSDYRFFYE